MIEVFELRKAYGQVQALRGISLKLSSGRITGILGPNGCGKTTLIKSILGLVVPDGGVVRLNGEVITGGWEHRSRIGYMPQNPEFPGNLSVIELLDMLEDIRGIKANRRDELIRLFDLQPHAKKSFGTLSGGTKQKVAAVAAFMFDPEILVLDEPTVGLDPVAAVCLKNLIAASAKAGRTILLVTHMVNEIEQLVQEMVFVLDGHVRFSGSLDDARTRAGVTRLEDAVVRLLQSEKGSGPAVGECKAVHT